MTAWRRRRTRDRHERELDAELRDHLERLTADLAAGGLDQGEARRLARLEFGGLDQMKDACRDQRALSFVNGVGQDVRLACRSLRAAPVVSAVAILSLALGIGANTAIFSLVNSLLLRTLPVVEPHRLAIPSSGPAAARGVSQPWTFAMWDQIRQRPQMFDGALAWSVVPFNLADGGEMQPVDGLYTSGDFFTTLGVPALVGRTFTAADDVRGGGPAGAVAVLSHGFWQRHFGGAAGAVGSTLVLDRVPFTVVGVTPPSFFGAEVGRDYDVAVPMSAEALIRGQDTWLDRRTMAWLTVMIRLKSGQSLEAGTAALRGVQPQIREAALPTQWPEPLRARFMQDPLTLVPAAGGNTAGFGLRARYQQPLLTMLCVVALVLLIACANVANLLLARATARRHELSLRLALGAPRWRLARQFVAESLVLSAAGALGGLVFAAWGTRALVAQLSAFDSRVFVDLSLDWRVLAFTAAVTVATSMLFGTAPAFSATRVPAITVLKESGRGGTFGGRLTLANGLVVAQVALSLVLVVAAGLFVRTFERLATRPLGFDPDHVLVADVSSALVPLDPDSRMPFYTRLVEAVAAVPGVAHAGGSFVTPLSGSGGSGVVEVAGAPAMSERDRSARHNYITPGWFAAYGTPILQGRDVDHRDTAAAPQVIVINDAFARRFFPGRNPLGGTVTIKPERVGVAPIPRTVVGVAGNAVYQSVREDFAVRPIMYLPLAQSVGLAPLGSIQISVRAAAGSPVGLSRSVAAALTAIDRNLTFSLQPLANQVRASLIQERLVAVLSGFFGGLALLLAALGLYGVTAYAVSRRRTEIGIRMALGAAPAAVVRLVLSRVVMLVGLGAAIGCGLSLWASTFIASLLYGLEPRDPFTLVGAVATLAAVGVAAGWLPVRRASRVDPAAVLRQT
jgi:putative ABC transport system permease protein